MMAATGLSPLQERILRELAGMQPAWTLFGAGALIGFYLGHRTTRDLDLAFRPRLELGEIPREVEARLRRVGLEVMRVQTALSFVRMRVSDAAESVELALTALLNGDYNIQVGLPDRPDDAVACGDVPQEVAES